MGESIEAAPGPILCTTRAFLETEKKQQFQRSRVASPKGPGSEPFLRSWNTNTVHKVKAHAQATWNVVRVLERDFSVE